MSPKSQAHADAVQSPPSADKPDATSGPPVEPVRCPTCHHVISLSAEHPEEIVCPGCGSSFRVRDDRMATTLAGTRTLGRFQLIQQVGVGAFGSVWRAIDTELQRTVALKVPQAGFSGSEGERERFHREARAAAQLRHPGIVSIHEVQIIDGLPMIVEDFIHGVTLRDMMQVRRLTFHEAAGLIADVAEALEYAHLMGLVHRDIKPANLMIEDPPPALAGDKPASLGRPLIMDFGLALRDQAEVTMTMDGHILGTPAYMSPEQAAGQSHQADRRSDVFSLGVVLYELLTGELPFRGSKAMLVHQVLHEEPRPPRKINDKIPRDLETICQKAMAKRPAWRYATARELAEDLRRFLQDQPILARPARTPERVWRWCKRKPALAGLLGVTTLSLVGGLVASSYFAVQASQRLNDALASERDAQRAKEQADANAIEAKNNEIKADEQRKAADRLRDVARDQLALASRRIYVGDIRQAQAAWDQRKVVQLLQILDLHQPSVVQADLRGWEWYFLRGLCFQDQFTLRGHRTFVDLLAWSPDGKLLASASTDVNQEGKNVKVWDATEGREVLTLSGHRGGVTALVWSPQGQWLASGGRDGSVQLWNARDGAAGPRLEPKAGPVQALAWRPDGEELAVARQDKDLLLWSIPNGATQFLKGHASPIRAVAWSSDGAYLASSSSYRLLKVWNRARLECVRNLVADISAGSNSSFVPPFAWSPKGKTLAWASNSDRIQQVEVESGKVLASYSGVPGPPMQLDFSPDGRYLGVSTAEGVGVWSTAAGGRPVALRAGGLHAWDKTGTLLATASPSDDLVRVYEIEQRREIEELAGHLASIHALAAHPHQPCFASASGDGTVRIWNVAPEQRNLRFETSVSLAPVPDAADVLDWSRDGQRLVVICRDRKMRICNAFTGKPEVVLTGMQTSPNSSEWSPDGRRLATAAYASSNKPSELLVWDTHTGQLLRRLTPEHSIDYVTWSPDGRYVAVRSWAPRAYVVDVWDPDTGKRVRTLDDNNGVSSFAWSPDSKRIGISTSWATNAWDMESGQRTELCYCKAASFLSWSPDGKMLAATRWDAVSKLGAVEFWPVDRAQASRSLSGHGRPVQSFSWSPDSKRFLSVAGDEVKVWDVATASEVWGIRTEPARWQGSFWYPDGKRIATGNTTALHYWDASRGYANTGRLADDFIQVYPRP